MMNIAPTTFEFLNELRQNNNREWFTQHKDRYVDAHQNVIDFVEALIARLSDFDPQISNSIDARKCLFRIYRDVRFSKNKSPYKNWFAAGISVDGRKLDGPEYYLHIEPGKSFIALGYWRPKKEHLEAIRQEIDYNGQALHDALQSGGWDEQALLMTEDQLVRPPAGYAADHENIQLLKLKSFILSEDLSQKDLEGPQAIDKAISFCQRGAALKNYIHQAIDQ